MRLRNNGKLSPVVVTLTLTIILAVVALVTGPLTRAFLPPMQAEPVNYVTTYLLLAAFGLLITALMWTRASTTPPAKVDLLGDLLIVTSADCDTDVDSTTAAKRRLSPKRSPLVNFAKQIRQSRAKKSGGLLVWNAQQYDEDSAEDSITAMIQSGTRHDYQVVILQGITIPEEIERLWKLMPKMRVLDVQKSRLPVSFWPSLEVCRELDHVLVHEATPDAPLKEILTSTPELKIHQTPLTVAVRAISMGRAR